MAKRSGRIYIDDTISKSALINQHQSYQAVKSLYPVNSDQRGVLTTLSSVKSCDASKSQENKNENSTMPELVLSANVLSSYAHSSASSSQPSLMEITQSTSNQKKIYQIESHSILRSLETKHIGLENLQTKLQEIQNELPVAVEGDRHSHKKITIHGNATNFDDKASPCKICIQSKEMPPVHFAAYAGHVSCLSILLKEARISQSGTLSNTSYLDKKSRTPLFYACASNQINTCTFLLQAHPEWRDMTDNQLDSPIHVCCFFGWHDCLNHLLVAGANPHIKNAKGFRPSHIAKSVECLELLLTYGDDLMQGDQLGRTPLFIACTRDRSICVDYLCAWNYRSSSWMLDQEDSRGDKPIHAASCNGCVSSLVILLKYGADVLVKNSKGMTPKQLAANNKHLQCVKLLDKAEREQNTSTSWYSPIQSHNNESAYVVAGCATTTVTPTNCAWSQCWDESSNHPYYYNSATGKCQWEKPENVDTFSLHDNRQKSNCINRRCNEKQQSASALRTSSGGEDEDDPNSEYIWVKKKRTTVCIVPGKKTEWTAIQDPETKAIYYKNSRTGKSQWEEPDVVQKLQEKSSAHTNETATGIWDEIQKSRNNLAKALAADRNRQQENHLQTLQQHREHIKERHDDIRKKEEQAKIQRLLPRASFVNNKKQSIMTKIKASGQLEIDDADKLLQICTNELCIDMFMSTYFRLSTVRGGPTLTTEKRLWNCLYHYYVALIDPVYMPGMSESQFRLFLKHIKVLPKVKGQQSGFAMLQVQLIDLIFAQMAQSTKIDESPREACLNVIEFLLAMEQIKIQIIDIAKDIDKNEDEWFACNYVIPLVIRLGTKLLTMIRESKELELELKRSDYPTIAEFLENNRPHIQTLHRYYSQKEPKLKMLSYYGLSQFVLDFQLQTVVQLPKLYQIYEAINWTSGNAHTTILSFEKFQLILAILAVECKPGDNSESQHNETCKYSKEQCDLRKSTCQQELGLLKILTVFFYRLENNTDLLAKVRSDAAKLYSTIPSLTSQNSVADLHPSTHTRHFFWLPSIANEVNDQSTS